MRLTLLLSLLLVDYAIPADIPGCNYFDTVDLSKNEKLSNGSYIYENVVIPAEQTGVYEYEVLSDGATVSVAPHLRGCACKEGTCIRFCCHRNLFLVQDERTCSGDIATAVDYDPIVNVTLMNGSVVTKHILNDFVVQQDLPVPCSAHFSLNPEVDAELQWTLFEDGTLSFSNKTVSKQEYCLQPHPFVSEVDKKTKYTLVPHACHDLVPPDVDVDNTLRIISIVCLLVTSCTYLWLRELRNLHGLCLVCYMLSLIVSFTLLVADSMKGQWTLGICQANGYIGYFATIAAFFWLTVISYDLWMSFRDNYQVQRTRTKFRFLMYSLYAWGCSFILTIIVMIIDGSLDMDDDNQMSWMPGVAIYYCWINTEGWSGLLYFYGPMAIQLIFNTTMFILTWIRILEVKKELDHMQGRDERQSQVESNRRTYGLFLRLFVIMGVTWTTEIIGYLVSGNDTLKKIFRAFDYINCGHGIVIFVLFVLKKRIFKLVSNRLRPKHRNVSSHPLMLSTTRVSRASYSTARKYATTNLNAL